MHRVLIVAIRSVVEIVPISIIVDQQKRARVVTRRIIIVRRPVVHVELMISLSIRIVLVVSRHSV